MGFREHCQKVKKKKFISKETGGRPGLSFSITNNMFLDLQYKNNMALKRVKINMASKTKNKKNSLAHRIGEASIQRFSAGGGGGGYCPRPPLLGGYCPKEKRFLYIYILYNDFKLFSPLLKITFKIIRKKIFYFVYIIPHPSPQLPY